MIHRRALIFLSLFLLSAAGIFLAPGCANIIPPAGGPRDSIPPVLVRSTPHDSTRNFNGNRIQLSFDEYIELQSPQENVVISPLPKNFPDITYRLNTVTVRLRDSLESNTTYNIQFGNAIKDFTEGNVMKGFNYTFSTGNYIDSLTLSGKVILAESGKIDTTLIVMLHSDPDDSAVVKQRPRYIARLDANGRFVFRNLPPRQFYLYALKDETGTRRYFRDNQLFAFASKPVNPGSGKEEITLYAYSAKPSGSLLLTTLSTNKTKGAATQQNRLRYTTNLSGVQQDLLGNLKLNFETPLKHFDSTSLRLYTDSAFVPAPNYHWSLDSTKKVLTLQHTWMENRDYHLVLGKDFAEDSSGRKLLKTDTLHFHTKKLADYGGLKIRLRNLDLSKNPVLQVMVGETIYRSYPMMGNEISETMFLPGDYELRILFDENKNGKWDPGEFFGKHKQPEIVQPIDRKITVRPSFTNEFEITL